MTKEQIILGKKTFISDQAQIIFRNNTSILRLGDYCHIGDGVKIIIEDSDVWIDDWTTVHDNSLILCKLGVKIGQHCWFGQNSIIDGTGGLVIGNGVRVGMYSQIWSHVAAGEQFDGCTLYAERQVVIDDNVWLVGSCIVASGVTIGKNAVALIGSNITKDIKPGQVVAGVPATHKDSLGFYKPISLEQKYDLVRSWLIEFKKSVTHQVIIEETNTHISLMRNLDRVQFYFRSTDYLKEKQLLSENVTLVDLEGKRYLKSLNALEYDIFKFLSSNKARFLRDSSDIS